MALELEKELPSGVSGNYWRIATVQVNYYTNRVVVLLGLFKDKSARDAQKDALFHQEIAWETDAFPLGTQENIRAIAYGKIKEMEAFTPAIDA